jgi:hypothetical protein
VTYGGDSGNRIFVLYWRCPLIRVSVIRGYTVFGRDCSKYPSEDFCELRQTSGQWVRFQLLSRNYISIFVSLISCVRPYAIIRREFFPSVDFFKCLQDLFSEIYSSESARGPKIRRE